MCGIVGFNWHDPKRLEKMAESLCHRGPDGKGEYLDPFVSLGHRRLSIIDLSSAGHQPMPNEDETLWLIYNGEIYNYLEIKRELEDLGHSFKTSGDTEVLLRAYEAWGSTCVERFNGMWAFALLDIKNQCVILC